MKKLIYSLILILGTQFIVSQNIYDALRYSNNEVEGSARFSAMSGAFGALGGELSAISINPAGSAIYSKGMASITFGNNYTKNNTNLAIFLICYLMWILIEEASYIFDIYDQGYIKTDF